MWDYIWQPYVHFAAELRVFFRAVLASYPDDETLLVVRTVNAACCADARNAEQQNYATGGRVALFNAEILRAASEELPPVRTRVWDVFALGDARDPATAARLRTECGPPHEHAPDVMIEDELLLNGLCHEWGEGHL